MEGKGRADLNSTGLRIERMWREGAPRLVAQLETQGTLYGMLWTLQEEELKVYAGLVQQGMTVDQAKELAQAGSRPPAEED